MSAPDQETCGKMARKVNRAKDLTGLTVGRHGLGLTPTQVLIQTRTQALSDPFSLFTPSMSVELWYTGIYSTFTTCTHICSHFCLPSYQL